MAYDVTILNTIRNSASDLYQSRIPTATQDNISAIGNAILNYTPTFNEFTGLLGKIAKTIVESKMAKNPLERFKKGSIDSGQDIEEIFVEMAQSEGAFDPLGSNPLGRRKPDVRHMFHRENRQDKYVVSISRVQVKSAFHRSEGIQNLLNKIVNSIYSADKHDEFILMKELLAQYEDNYFDYQVEAITDTASTQAFLRTVRKAVADLSFMSDKYNKQNVHTFTDRESQALIIHKDVIAHVDVDVLAKTFNIGKTDFEPTIVVVDDFGTMEDTYGLLIDNEFFMVFDTLFETAEQFNADGLFTNVFLHHHQVLSLSQFKNAIRFTTAEPPVEG